jgi:hypothetical protein
MDTHDGQVTLAIALFATSIATASTLLLWRKGLLSGAEAKEQADVFRNAAKLFEGLGNDREASKLWTAANLLETEPPPE